VGDAGRDLRLEGVTKNFGDFVAVDDLTITVPEGSFFALLGPSGCGKTTTLRMVAGLEEPTQGRVLIGEEDITDLRPYKRPVNTVFQSYALFPHLTVFENVAFGLRRRAVKDYKKKTEEMIELVELGAYGSRKPAQLSGGQQQRVALARAMINEPGVLLLDEPLGALDLKLRKEMQLELKALQREVGITFVYVTHDQEEALTMSDVIVVMRDGLIQQQGDPTELYERPVNRFVADFIGTSNFIEATVVEPPDGERRVVVRSAKGLTLRGRITDPAASLSTGDTVIVASRPERMEVVPSAVVQAPGANTTHVPGRIKQGTYLGDETEYRVETEQAGELIVRHQNATGAGGAPGVGPGDPVVVRWHEEANLILAG
jgi:spermidine/putrescine transport system ATP-binding protein